MNLLYRSSTNKCYTFWRSLESEPVGGGKFARLAPERLDLCVLVLHVNIEGLIDPKPLSMPVALGTLEPLEGIGQMFGGGLREDYRKIPHQACSARLR